MTTKREIRNAPAVEPNAAYFSREYDRVNGEIAAAFRNAGNAKRLGRNDMVTYWNRRKRELGAIRQYLAGQGHQAEIAEAKASGTPIHIKSPKRNAFATLCGRSTIDLDTEVIAMSRPDLAVEGEAFFCADCVRLAQ